MKKLTHQQSNQQLSTHIQKKKRGLMLTISDLIDSFSYWSERQEKGLRVYKYIKTSKDGDSFLFQELGRKNKGAGFKCFGKIELCADILSKKFKPFVIPSNPNETQMAFLDEVIFKQ